MRTLIIGSNTIDLAAWSQHNFPTSQLLTNSNFNLVKDTAGDFYTSLVDLKKENLIESISIADRVIYKDPVEWTSLELKEETHRIFYYSKKPIENFTKNTIDTDPGDLLSLMDSRISDTAQVWVSGCSFAYGIGVNDNERYGELFAKTCNLPVSFLTSPGTSISWAGDQILRSDIRKGDIVLWGLTSINRFQIYRNRLEAAVSNSTFSKEHVDLRNRIIDAAKNKNVKSLYKRLHALAEQLPEHDKKELELNLISEDRLMQAVKSIFQVINFCKQLDVKLIIFLHEMSTYEFEYFLMKYISLLDNFTHISPIVDYGNTNTEHPGPLTHQLWANELIAFAKEKQFI